MLMPLIADIVAFNLFYDDIGLMVDDDARCR